jgi:hypothetical protein
MLTADVGAASAAEPTFSAHGRVEQVYVTGATPGEQLSLVDGTGSTVSTRDVNSLGGALFRSVTVRNRRPAMAAITHLYAGVPGTSGSG